MHYLSGYTEKRRGYQNAPLQTHFPQNCIDEWLKQGKAVCPMCRRGIFDDDEVNWYLEGKAKDTDRIVAKWGSRSVLDEV